MARRLVFDHVAWEHYLYWQSQVRKTLERINTLIRECQRDPFRGIGKPEPRKANLAGFWSRRIDDTNRLVYRINGDFVEILSCRYHESDL